MDVLVSHLHGAVSDVFVTSEVSAVVADLVAGVERSHDADRRSELKAAVAVARKQLELMAGHEKRLTTRASERARQAAALRSALAQEVARVASELRAKAKLESELVAARAGLEDSEDRAAELERRVAEAAAAAAEAGKEREGLQAAVAEAQSQLQLTTTRHRRGDMQFFSLRRGPLMTVFQFLETRDVLALACTNWAMYQRVDSVFAQQQQQQQQQQQHPRGHSNGAGRGAGAGGLLSGTSMGPGTSNTSPVLRAVLNRGAVSPSAYSLGSHGGGDADESVRRASFSTFSPKRRGAGGDGGMREGGGIPARAASVRNPRQLAAQQRQAPAAMRRHVAQLSSALEECQAHLTASRTENEDTRQRLAAAVRVRQFLVERLADTEAQVRAAKEEKERVLAQAASDREVMTFLDDRVRELEEGARQSAAEIARLKQHVVDARGTHTSKAKVLEEMVRMATAQRQDAEAQFKSQKKLLVKEIKTLRAAVSSLQQERVKLISNVGVLRDAVKKNSKGGAAAGAASH